MAKDGENIEIEIPPNEEEDIDESSTEESGESQEETPEWERAIEQLRLEFAAFSEQLTRIESRLGEYESRLAQSAQSEHRTGDERPRARGFWWKPIIEEI